MFELTKVADNTFTIESPARIGLYSLNDKEVVLIDSGNDKDAGRKLRKILDAKHWQLKAIYNTHSNADHIGGNCYLQNQTRCKVYSPPIEAEFTRYPALEPSFLYDGYPFKELRHKFLMAQECEVDDLTSETLPEGFEIIPLSGHFFNMVGYRTPDDVLFLADCLSSQETLEKYQISFIYDVKAYIETLEKVSAMDAKLYVPAHAPIMKSKEELQELCLYNKEKIFEIAQQIMSICVQPQPFEEILKKLFDHYSLTMTFEQYVLVGSTIRSYLSWLKDQGKIMAVIEDNRLLWQTSPEAKNGTGE